jgi:hypothetical protein
MSKMRSDSHIFLSVLASLAMLTGAGIVTPYPCFAGDDLTSASLRASVVKCAPAAVPSTRQCHLDLNDRMKMGAGTWGSNIVHPHGPNYFCVERHIQLEEERNRGCR